MFPEECQGLGSHGDTQGTKTPTAALNVSVLENLVNEFFAAIRRRKTQVFVRYCPKERTINPESQLAEHRLRRGWVACNHRVNYLLGGEQQGRQDYAAFEGYSKSAATTAESPLPRNASCSMCSASTMACGA